jgi:hypothetical protein
MTAFDLLPCGVPHMETSVRYLEFAVKCDRLAKLAKTEEDRMILKEMAEAWKKVAREADVNRRLFPSSESPISSVRHGR